MCLSSYGNAYIFKTILRPTNITIYEGNIITKMSKCNNLLNYKNQYDYRNTVFNAVGVTFLKKR